LAVKRHLTLRLHLSNPRTFRYLKKSSKDVGDKAGCVPGTVGGTTGNEENLRIQVRIDASVFLLEMPPARFIFSGK
jgi:hypothetical protein